MQEWGILQYVVAAFAVMVVSYVLIRLWSYGIFRSYFQAKKLEEQEDKENGKAKQTFDEGSVDKKIGR